MAEIDRPEIGATVSAGGVRARIERSAVSDRLVVDFRADAG